MSAVEQYPRDAYYLVATGATLNLGTFVTTGGDLALAELRIYHKNPSPFSYTMRLSVSSSFNGPELLTSETVTITDVILGQTTADWVGNIVLEFDDYSLISGETYYFKLVTTGYTRNGDLLYLSVNCDWLNPIGTGNTAGARLPLGVML